jgi:hypothetical protein
MNELIFLLIIIILIFISMPFIYIYNLTEERLETIINKVEPLNQYMKLKIEVFLGNISSLEDTELAMNISTLDDEDYYKVYSILTKAIKLAKKDKNELLYYQLISYFIINYSLKVFNLGTLIQKLKIVNYIVILKKNKYIK